MLSRRGATATSQPIELLIVDKSNGPVPTPPHPSTIKPTKLLKSMPVVRLTHEDYETSALLRDIVKPLEELGVVADATIPGVNVWQGWIRVPKKSESWESRKERLDGVQTLNGDFCPVNITYVFSPEPALTVYSLVPSSFLRYAPKQSQGSALLTLTGDKEYVLDCAQKAFQAGLYLNEWGLWEWEPDSQSLSRFQTSDTPHENTTLGALWGSETKADKGRWIRLEAAEEEQVLAAIGGEYVLPEKRNFRFLMKPKKRGPKPATRV